MDIENKSGIYCIENIITGKKYIGQSRNITDRWKRHINELEHSYHFNDYLQKSWNKYGKDNFKFYVLEYCLKENLDERENYYIKIYDTMNRSNGYNLKSGGQNGGAFLSKTSAEKLSNSIKNSYKSSDLREIRKKDALKQWSNPEIKKKILGSGNGMYGKHHTEEVKKKISEANKGRKNWRRDCTPVFCVELNKVFEDATTASKELSIDSSGILKVCRKERQICGGYHWEFINNREII